MLWWKLQRLKSSKDHIRRNAIKGLCKSQNPRAMAAVMIALNDESYMVRKEAAYAIGEIGDAQTVEPLINLIEESLHYAIARNAVVALEKVLARVAVSVMSKDIKAAAVLDDVSGTYYESRKGMAWFSEARNGTPWKMDCSQVRKLANRELIRRGLSD